MPYAKISPAAKKQRVGTKPTKLPNAKKKPVGKIKTQTAVKRKTKK